MPITKAPSSSTAVLVLSLLLSGCSSEKEKREYRTQFYSNTALSLRYFQDTRTNLCFAFGFREATIVPCTPEVLALLENPSAD